MGSKHEVVAILRVELRLGAQLRTTRGGILTAMTSPASESESSPGSPADLLSVVLEGGSWPAVLTELAAAIHAPVRYVTVHGTPMTDGVLARRPADAPVGAVTDPDGPGLPETAVERAFATGEPTPATSPDGLSFTVHAVRAGGRRVGALGVGAAVTLPHSSVDSAVLALGVDALRRDAQADALAETASRLVDEIRYGSLRPDSELVDAGHRFGIDLGAPHAAAVFEYRGANVRAWNSAVQWLETPVRRDDVLAFTVLPTDPPIAANLHRIRSRLESITGTGAVFAASGPTVDTVAQTARSFREAAVVLALLRARGGRELPFEAVGPASLMLAVDAERLHEYVTLHLGSVLDRPDLLETLAAWFATNGSRQGVAERLSIHRNSVGYRIGRLRELMGHDFTDPTVRAAIAAALDAREVLAARGDPASPR